MYFFYILNHHTRVFLMSLHLKIGVMYSGKTRAVMEEIIKSTIALQSAVLIRHSKDTRYAHKRPLAVSHDGQSMSCIVAHDLSVDPPELPSDIQVVAIDEGQFFEGLADFCIRMISKGVTIHVAALNSNFKLEMWPNVVKLIPIATTITMYRGVCILCQKDATCSRRITKDTQETLIGADDTYVATCYPCFDKPIGQEILQARSAALERAKIMTEK